MATRGILSKSIPAVTFLFAAFGSFLVKIAPPGGMGHVTQSAYVPLQPYSFSFSSRQ